MSNEFVVKNGLVCKGDLSAVGNISGSNFFKNGIELVTVEDIQNFSTTQPLSAGNGLSIVDNIISISDTALNNYSLKTEVESLSSNLYSELSNYVSTSQLEDISGVPNGLATLDADGKVPLSQLPAVSGSYVELSNYITSSYFQSISGQPNGLATLGSDGKVPSEQLSTSSGYEGIIHITNITNSGNIQKTYVENTGNNVIASFTSDTNNNTLELTGISLNNEWYPTVQVDDTPITGWVEQSNGKFKTSYVLSLTGSGNIQAVHANGTSHTINYNISTVGPEVLTAVLGSFPVLPWDGGTNQTDLKQSDVVNITGTCENSTTYVEVVDDSGSIFAIGNTTVVQGVTTFSLNGTVSSRTGAKTLKLRARNSLGTYGATFTGTSVTLDQASPVIGASTITYPVSQGALKNSETATVTSTVTDYTSIVYSSPTSELNITNTTTYENIKTVTRSSGSYNVSSNNFRIEARKASNGKTTTTNSVVFIANIAPTINLTYPSLRLRSSPSGLNHLVTATSNQRLTSFVLNDSSIGTFQNSWIGATNNTIWTRNLQIIDSDVKGVGTLSSMVATGLSNLTQTSINTGSTFTVGGFTSRTLTISAWPNREVGIGTQVSNTSKLLCEVLSKGGEGSNGGTNFTYSDNTSNAINQFTITQPTTIANSTGNIWYNKDQSNAVSNTGGSAQVIIEEIV
jgi:hypothetical protein